MIPTHPLLQKNRGLSDDIILRKEVGVGWHTEERLQILPFKKEPGVSGLDMDTVRSGEEAGGLGGVGTSILPPIGCVLVGCHIFRMPGDIVGGGAIKSEIGEALSIWAITLLLHDCSVDLGVAGHSYGFRSGPEGCNKVPNGRQNSSSREVIVV